MELLRKEYQRISERNEDLMNENRKLRNSIRDVGTTSIITKEKLLSENDSLKSEVTKIINFFGIFKENFMAN